MRTQSSLHRMLDAIIEKASSSDDMEAVRSMIVMFNMELYAFLIELRGENIKKNFGEIHEKNNKR